VEMGYRERRIAERERECVVVLSGGELNGGRRVTMLVSPQSKSAVHIFKTLKTFYKTSSLTKT